MLNWPHSRKFYAKKVHRPTRFPSLGSSLLGGGEGEEGKGRMGGEEEEGRGEGGGGRWRGRVRGRGGGGTEEVGRVR